MTWPAIVAWVLILGSTLMPGPVPLLYVFMGLGAFTSLNVLPGETVTLVPQNCSAAFFICKILLTKDNLSRGFDAAIDFSKLGFLFAFLLYGLFAAFLMPRLFAHMVEVVPVNALMPIAPLGPNGSNITQSGLTVLSVGTVLAFTLAGGNESFRRHFLLASLLGGVVLFLTGIADMVVPRSLLEPFRNAYAVSVATQQAGITRVVGLTPEASGFGPPCIIAASLLTFLRPCFENAILRIYAVPLTIIALLVMGALSVSSTALVGIPVFAVAFALNWLRRALSSSAPTRGALKTEAIVVFVGMFAALTAILLNSHIFDSIYDVIDVAVFRKSETDSYYERMQSSKIAIHAFFATGGLGIGLGSTRTSNWFAAVLGSTGVAGTVFLGAFFLRLFILPCRSKDALTKEFVSALRFSLLPTLLMMAVSWPAADFGVALAPVLGLIASLTMKEQEVTAAQSSPVPLNRLMRARRRSFPS